MEQTLENDELNSPQIIADDSLSDSQQMNRSETADEILHSLISEQEYNKLYLKMEQKVKELYAKVEESLPYELLQNRCLIEKRLGIDNQTNNNWRLNISPEISDEAIHHEIVKLILKFSRVKEEIEQLNEDIKINKDNLEMKLRQNQVDTDKLNE